jgi:hypothetical protein
MFAGTGTPSVKSCTEYGGVPPVGAAVIGAVACANVKFGGALIVTASADGVVVVVVVVGVVVVATVVVATVVVGGATVVVVVVGAAGGGGGGGDGAAVVVGAVVVTGTVVVVCAVVVCAVVVTDTTVFAGHEPARGRTSPLFRRRDRLVMGTVTFSHRAPRRWHTTAVPRAGQAPRVARTSPGLRVFSLSART